MERNSFIFYKGWREAIKDLPDDVRLEIAEFNLQMQQNSD